MTLHKRELEAAILAVTAGLNVARRREGADTIALKSGVDVVTAADVSAEDAMRGVLRKHCPEIAIVGEERGSDSLNPTRYWLIDPICGTRNYASELPLYCTNLALVDTDQVLVAVVGDGVDGSVYAAARDKPAFVASDAQHPALHARDGSIIALDLNGHPPYSGSRDGVGRLYAALVSHGGYHIRMFGTTLPFAKVATGTLAAALMVPGGEPSEPLHFAAGCALAESAGAIVSDARGGAWHPRSSGFILAATKKLHAYLVDLVRHSFEL